MDQKAVSTTTWINNEACYYISKNNSIDGSFFVVENIDSPNWIEWHVKKEPVLENMLFPSGIYSWKMLNDTTEHYCRNGTVTLYDATRSWYSRLSSKGWFLKTDNSDFWFYREGYWSTVRPIEITNGTMTFESCQKVVNNCDDGRGQPGCCGPKGNKKCCHFNINKCYSC